MRVRRANTMSARAQLGFRRGFGRDEPSHTFVLNLTVAVQISAVQNAIDLWQDEWNVQR